MKNLRLIFTTILSFFYASFLNAQIGINATGSAPAINAMLDVSSTTKGMLIPRMTTPQRITLTTTATDGLTVYDTDTHSFWFYNGTAWTPLSTGNNWINNGNDIYNGNTANVGIGIATPISKLDVRNGDLFVSSQTGSIKYGYPAADQWRLATFNSGQDLSFQSSPNGVNFTERVFFDNNGNVGIGSGLPTGKLHIESAGNSNTIDSNVDPMLRMRLTNDINYGWVRFENSAGLKSFSQRFDLFSNTASNSYSLFYGTDQLFTVKGDGKFGLNVATPLDLLHLSPITATGDVYARISSTTGLTGIRLQNNTGDWSIYSNEFSKLFIGYSANNFATNAEVIIAEPNATDYNFRPSTTNQVLLGTAAYRWKETNTITLDVSGNANVTGEINRNQTGSSNMVPIAYGTLNSAGTAYITAFSGNFTSSKIATGTYSIYIVGETYTYFNYIATATPNDSNAFTTPIFITTSSNAGNLIIKTYNLAGTLTDSPFSFVVYKQ
jgi:hypothetical protein